MRNASKHLMLVVLFTAFLVIASTLVSAVTIGVNTQLWVTESGMHLNVTYPFSVSSLEVGELSMNITSNAYQVINIENVNTSQQSNITYFGLGSYNSIFNQSNTVPEAENVASYLQNLTQSQRSIIITYPDANKWINKIASDVETLSYAYDSTNKILYVNCTGSDGFNVTKLGVLGRTVYVYKDSALQTKLISETGYATTSCGNWEFEYTLTEEEDFALNAKPSLISAYLTMASFMSIIVIIAMIGGIIYLIFQWRDGKIDMSFNSLQSYLYGAAFILMIAVVVIMVMVVIITTASNILPK